MKCEKSRVWEIDRTHTRNGGGGGGGDIIAPARARHNISATERTVIKSRDLMPKRCASEQTQWWLNAHIGSNSFDCISVTGIRALRSIRQAGSWNDEIANCNYTCLRIIAVTVIHPSNRQFVDFSFLHQPCWMLWSSTLAELRSYPSVFVVAHIPIACAACLSAIFFRLISIIACL